MAPASGETSDDIERDRPFLCGVVEGFYGRPWTLAQRKELFEKMETWGMDSYLYAPKDDCKHRAFWRDLYTVEEADHLQSLISTAHSSNVDFYYAISPGLDIAYSNSKEVATLKRKLDQVAQLGCRAFALLFDDIEAEMSKPDKEAFQSFAAAQVSVTNEIYQHLGQPKFLFCPTQYCTTRAIPTIASSEYLKTIGSKLAPDINIMWTGDKVIPKEITVESLEEITRVLKRSPVIWDNEHANDYDQRRIYLGPYSGRSPDIIPKLSGVLTNPNCEYGANFVAIHSLAAWSKCSVDGCSSLSPSDPVTQDIKLELDSRDPESGGEPCPESEQLTHLPCPPPDSLPPHVYHPRHALRAAVKEWLHEFKKPKPMWGPITKPQVGLNPTGILQPSVNTCMTSTATTSSVQLPLPLSSVSSLGQSLATTHSPKSDKPSSPLSPDPVLPTVSPYAALVGGVSVSSSSPSLPLVSQPVTVAPLVPVMNSLVSQNEVILERPVPELPPSPPDPLKAVPEPMDTLPTEAGAVSPQTPQAMESTTNPPTPSMVDSSTAPPSPDTQSQGDPNTAPATPASAVMQVEPPIAGSTLSKAESTTMLCETESVELSPQELELVCDLFYLPSEHGPGAIDLLSDFYWLKTHAGVMLQGSRGSSQADPTLDVGKAEWLKRKSSFVSRAATIRRVFEGVCLAVNRELVYSLYTYLWDMVGVLHMLTAYIEWLQIGAFSPKYRQLIIGRHTWFSGIREAFQSGDHEPWVFRGGLTADLQRLMPVDAGNDLFIYQYPDTPTSQLYQIRPYRPCDESSCYSVALATWQDGMDASQDYPAHPSLVGEKCVGSLLSFNQNLAFVFENNSGQIVGYILAAPNLKEYHQRVSHVWLPELRNKYPLVEPPEGELLTPCDLTINSLHVDPGPLPTYIEDPDTWALCRLAILPSVLDSSLARRATMLLLACLRTSGVLQVLSEVPRKERYMADLYSRMGFSPLLETPSEGGSVPDSESELVYMFRRY